MPPNIITVELFGSYGAKHIPTGTEVSFEKHKNPKGPISALCRKLLNEGIATCDSLIRVIRDGKRVFRDDRPISYWSEHTTVEHNTGIKRIKYQPYPKADG